MQNSVFSPWLKPEEAEFGSQQRILAAVAAATEQIKLASKTGKTVRQ